MLTLRVRNIETGEVNSVCEDCLCDLESEWEVIGKTKSGCRVCWSIDVEPTYENCEVYEN
jgi:hypothetical protein